MKHLSILKPASPEAIKLFAEKKGLSEYLSPSYQHPQEDYLVVSETLPIFAVADGVTLNYKKLIEEKQTYPNPSPAGEVARIFCEAAERAAREKYAHFSSIDGKLVFQEANQAVRAYNDLHGKTDIAGNPTRQYAATGCFLVVKDGWAYWTSICDSYFAHFDKDMNLKHLSSGRCVPYAVINGEEGMAERLEQHAAALEKGDRLFILTDGFESYIKNPDFAALFKDWDSRLEAAIEEFSEKMNFQDPEHYGHERSLIAVAVD